MKKIIALFMAAVLCVACFAGCAKKEKEIDPILIERWPELSETTLDEEGMAKAVKDYFDVFNDIMAEKGENIRVEVSTDDNLTTITTYRGNSEPLVLEYNNVQNAFLLLYTNGQIDIDGNILIDKNSVNY